MSNFTKSATKYHSLSIASTARNSQDSFIDISTESDSNPFDGKKSWDEFKREYYLFEKKIKKNLESLHLILIEFTRSISLGESKARNGDSTKKQCEDFKSISGQAKEELSQLSDLFSALRKNKGEADELIKQNMLKRFKEIYQEHEKEYTRLNNSFDMNKKKLELFNETMKLGELNVDKKLGSATALMMQNNQDLADAVATSHRVMEHANFVNRAFGNQQERISKINNQVKRLIDEFGGIKEIMKKIKYFKMKKMFMMVAIMVILSLYLVYRIFSS